MAHPEACAAGTDPEPSDMPATNDLKPLPDELKPLRDSIADAASVSVGLWTTYLGIWFYLLIAVGSVTHTDLFVQRSIRLPIMSTDLPMNGFFLLAPIVFLVLHAYVLLHFTILADKIRALNNALDEAPTMQAGNKMELRRQLPANFFVQFMAGPSGIRESWIGVLLRLIALISLAIGPIMLLLLFELMFVPYQSGVLTAVHGVIVLVDLWLLLWFAAHVSFARDKPARIIGTIHSMRRKGMRWLPPLPGFWGTGVTILTMIIAIYPLGPLYVEENLPPRVKQTFLYLENEYENYIYGAQDKTTRNGGVPDDKTMHSAVPFTRDLVLRKFDAVAHAGLQPKDKLDAAPQTVLVPRRSLQRAVLYDADLYKANLNTSDLTEANLHHARLTYAQLYSTTLTRANLTHADLVYADLTGADLTKADLTCANLIGADLSGSNLTEAKLTGANLTGKNLPVELRTSKQKKCDNLVDSDEVKAKEVKEAKDKRNVANPTGTNLTNANLTNAKLIGAVLTGAILTGAILNGANFTDSTVEQSQLDTACGAKAVLPSNLSLKACP